MQEKVDYVKTILEEAPEEQNELYKRRFIKIDFENFGKDNATQSVQDPVAFAKELEKGANVSFDVVMSPTHEEIRKSGIAKIEELKEYEGMYGRSEDKAIAFSSSTPGKLLSIEVPQGTNQNCNILAFSTNEILNARVKINVRRDSSLNVLIYSTSMQDSATLNSILNEIYLEPYSSVEVNLINNQCGMCSAVSYSKIECAANSSLKFNAIHSGGKVLRAKTEINASGNAARCNSNELILGSGSQKFDITTKIINNAEHTETFLTSKAALMDESLCILKGFAEIGEHAENSKSYVSERGILLDKTARIETIPGMGISNNNVKATHSSATMPIDSELLFYLTSRGLSNEDAKTLVVSGFFGSTISQIENTMAMQLGEGVIREKMLTKDVATTPKATLHGIWNANAMRSADDALLEHYKYR